MGTPGPWLINFDPEDDRRPLEIVTSDRDHRIAFLASDGNPDDARLISAAPDLLAACKAARRTIVAAVTLGVDLPGFDPAEHTVVRQIDAAIAKAEGRELNARDPHAPCSHCGKPWDFSGPCQWGGCPLGADL
jgi:hypothetical protein